MPPLTRLDIDLAIDLQVAGSFEPFATITASGTDVTIAISRPMSLRVDRRSALAWLAPLAAAAARRGIVIAVTGPAGLVARAGAVPSSALQRRLTGSRHIQLGSARALLALGGAPRSAPFRLPPSTPLPPFPTMERGRKDRITTTHYEPGSGRPRLIFTIGSADWDGTPPREFTLLPGTTVIGSDAAADLRLDGLGALRAEIRHEDGDEYVLYVDGPREGVLLDPQDGPIQSRTLRTGARIDLGPWKLAYFRAEFADHGRPHGGRLGGELSRQRPQPARRTS